VLQSAAQDHSEVVAQLDEQQSVSDEVERLRLILQESQASTVTYDLSCG
jgi:hypothetical protein